MPLERQHPRAPRTRATNPISGLQFETSFLSRGHALLLSGGILGSDIVVPGSFDVDVVDVLNVGGFESLVSIT